MKKKITISDIAKELGISKTTVSFVLNGKGKENHISDSLIEKILKYINEVGYRPNQFAQGLRTGKTKMIGMVVEDISDPFFATMARKIEENAYNKGYRILFASTENDAEKAKELIQIFRTRQVDGYIIAPPPGIEADIQDLMNDHVPVILFDRFFPELKTDNVISDNFGGTYNAISHFIENNFKNIAFVTLSSDQIQMKQRLDGYLKAVNDHGLKSYVKKVAFQTKAERSVDEIEEFIKENKEIDAIFFATDYLAESGLEAINNLELKVPDDLGVIAFDDYNLFRLFNPPVTALAQPISEIAKKVVELLIAKLADNSKPTSPETYTIPTQLVVRKSSLRHN